MLNNLQKRKSEGFTIIEVMIVLAIAGLIMLIIFLAVPALQRNSRNTQYKNDASAYAAGIAEWQQNNNGANVTATSLTTAGSGVNALVQLGKLAEPTTVSTLSSGSATPLTTGSPRIVVVQNGKCSTTTVGQVDYSPRAVAVQFAVETSNGVAPQCLDVN